MKEVAEVIGELAVDGGSKLEQAYGPQALATAREMRSALVPYLEKDPTYAPLWEAFQKSPQAMVPALAGIIQVLLAADAALARRLEALLATYERLVSSKPAGQRTYQTYVEGLYVRGNFHMRGGKVVGHDEIHNYGTATKESFQELLIEARKALPEASLPPETAEEVDDDLTKVQKEAEKPQPNGQVIISRLETIAKILTATGTVAVAAEKLGPYIQQAIQLAQQLFR